MNFSKHLNIVVFFISVFCSGFAYSSEKIFYIDLDYLLNNSIAGKSIIKQLEDENKLYLTNFKKIEATLKEEEKEIISQKNVLDKNEYEKKINLFNKNIKEYKKKREKDNKNISRMKADAQKILGTSLQKILADYSEKNSVSYIIPKQSIIIGKSELDITNKILNILNSKIKNIKVK